MRYVCRLPLIVAALMMATDMAETEFLTIMAQTIVTTPAPVAVAPVAPVAPATPKVAKVKKSIRVPMPVALQEAIQAKAGTKSIALFLRDTLAAEYGIVITAATRTRGVKATPEAKKAKRIERRDLVKALLAKHAADIAAAAELAAKKAAKEAKKATPAA